MHVPTSSRMGVPPATDLPPLPRPPGVNPPTVEGVPGAGVPPPTPPTPPSGLPATMELGVVMRFWRGTIPPNPVPSSSEALSPPSRGVLPEVRITRLRASCQEQARVGMGSRRGSGGEARRRLGEKDQTSEYATMGEGLVMVVKFEMLLERRRRGWRRGQCHSPRTKL